MLHLKNISKSFFQRGLVLDNLCFEVNQGESVAITGPSGSGKTTLMNIIGALDTPDSGEVIFRGVSLANLKQDDLAAYRSRNIGFVFQDHLLLNHLTISENIMLPLFSEKISEKEYADKEVYADKLLEQTGISGIKSKYPFQISGGEAQRATLVRALIREPAILLADEPTGSLDMKNAETLGNLLAEMNKTIGITLIVVTHSTQLASKMNRQMRLSDGKFI